MVFDQTINLKPTHYGIKQKKPSTTALVKEIKRQTKRVFSAEEKIKIVRLGEKYGKSLEDG